MAGNQHTNGAANRPPDAEQTFSFSLFKGERDNAPQLATGTWADVCELLSKHKLTPGDSDADKDGPRISGASYPEKVWRRAGKNKKEIDAPDNATPEEMRPPLRLDRYVEFVSLAFLDFDGGTTLEEIERGVAALNNGNGAGAFIHSTFSHNPDAGAFKYRLVLPLLSTVNGEMWDEVFKRLSLAFKGAPDRQAKDPSRMHILPRCPKSRAQHAVNIEIKGAPLNVATLPILPVAPPAEPWTPPVNAGADNYARNALKGELERLSGLREGDHRNARLNEAARRLGQFVAAGRLDRNEVEDGLFNAMRANSYVAKDGEATTRSTMESGLNAGRDEPNYKNMPANTVNLTGRAKLNGGATGTAVVSSLPLRSVSDEKTPQETPEVEAPPFELFTLADLETIPRPKWLIQNILIEGVTSIISADSGSFKSFIALDMALSVATGTPFHGLEVKRGTVVYIAAEGFFTMRDRATVWLMERKVARPDNIHFLRVPVNVSNPLERAKFAAQIKALDPALIILDTLSQNALGLNENSNDEMAGFVSGMMHLGTECGAHVCAVHHNSKAGGFRGASAIHANIDARISLERPEVDTTNTVFVRCEKQRGKPFAPFALRGEEVVLPYTDEYGEEITSLVFHIAGAAEIPALSGNKNKKSDTTANRLLEIFDSIAEQFNGSVKAGTWAAKAKEEGISNATFYRHLNTLCPADGGGVLHKVYGEYQRVPGTLKSENESESESESKGTSGPQIYSHYSHNPLGVRVMRVDEESAPVESGGFQTKQGRGSASEPYQAAGIAPAAGGMFAAQDAEEGDEY